MNSEIYLDQPLSTFTPLVKDKFYKILADNFLIVNNPKYDDLSLFHSVIDSETAFNILINDESHLKIILSTKTKEGVKLLEVYKKFLQLHKILDAKLNFEFDQKLGYINYQTNLVGIGMTVSFGLIMKNLLESKSELFEEVAKYFNGNFVKGDLSGLINFKIHSEPHESENAFLKRAISIVEKLTYINNNPLSAKVDQPSVVNLINSKIESTQQKNFLNSLKEAFNSVYDEYKYENRDNTNMGNVLESILNNQTDFKYYNLFPKFFINFFNQYHHKRLQVNFSPISHLATVANNSFELRDFNKNHMSSLLLKLSTLNVSIKRNVYKDGHLEIITIWEEIFPKIENSLNIKFTHDQELGYYSTSDNQIMIITNKFENFEDHLNFSFNLIEKEKILELLGLFINIYKAVANELQCLGYTYASHPDLAYLTRDLSNIGPGMEIKAVFGNPLETKLTLPYPLENAGSTLLIEEKQASIISKVNVNTSLGKILNYLNSFASLIASDSKPSTNNLSKSSSQELKDKNNEKNTLDVELENPSVMNDKINNTTPEENQVLEEVKKLKISEPSNNEDHDICVEDEPVNNLSENDSNNV